MAAIKGLRVRLASDVVVSSMQHEKLVNYCIERLKWANETRSAMVDKFEQIDKELHGHLVLDEPDRKRENDNQKGFGVKPVDSKLPLALVQLDEAVTIQMSMLAPDEGMYQAAAPVAQQDAAKGFTALMNKHAEQFNHYSNLAKGIGSAFKFNIAAWEINWCKIDGNVIKNAAGGFAEVVQETILAGNEFKFLSMYNTLWDPSVEPWEVSTKGEFYATVSMHTPFRINKMLQDGEIYNAKDLTDISTFTNIGYPQIYYRLPPIISSAYSGGSVQIPNWTELLIGGSSQVTNQIELINMPIWLVPKDFGLSTSGKLEIWRITLANNDRIVKVAKLGNAHNRLPCVFTRPVDDELGNNTKSYAELLIPFNRFSSFQLNTHQRAARRALYGLNFFNKMKIPALANKDTDMVAGNVPVDGSVDDIRKVFLAIHDAPDTANTLKDIDFMDSLMQKILPTDLLKQVTDLERATRYQAAATVQGSNRRSLKIARIINAQALQPARMMQMYNIYEYQELVDIITPEGKEVKVDPSQFREAQIEFVISDGLKGLDKLSLIEGMKEVLTLIIQNREAIQQFDVPKIIDYWTTLLGDRTNFSQFRIQSPLDMLPPDQKQIAFQLFQQYMQQQQGGGQQAAAAPGAQMPQAVAGAGAA